MTTTLTENELEFTFPDPWVASQFDASGAKIPMHIAPVDFLVERPHDLLLIEVKDPSNSRAPEAERQKYVKRMTSDELTHNELAPKARTTWSYLHLMGRTTKPLRYFVVLGAERLSIQPVLLQGLTDRLKDRLKCEADTPWAVPYIASCVVVPATELGKYLPGVTVVRKPVAD